MTVRRFTRLRSAASRAVLILAVALPAGHFAVPCALAQTDSGWNPFEKSDARPRRERPPAEVLPPPLAPMDGRLPALQPTNPEADPARRHDTAAPAAATGPMPGTGTVERVDLTPLPPPAGSDTAATPPGSRSAAPPSGRSAPADTGGADLWTGIDEAALEELLVPLDVPPRSPALHALWMRLMADGRPRGRIAAIQAEALWRSGLIGEVPGRLEVAGESDPVAGALGLRVALASGEPQRACAEPGGNRVGGKDLPKLLRAEMAVLAGYCAIAGSDPAAGGLAANLAREEDAPTFSVALLEAHAAGGKSALQRLAPPKRITVLDYRLIEALGPPDPVMILDRAEPALLATMAGPATKDQRLRIAALERAVALNAVAPKTWADLGRSLTAAAPNDPLFRRIGLLRAIGLEQTPVRRAQNIRALLEDARKSGLYLHAARAVAGALDEVQASSDLGPLAETAIELALAGGDVPRVRLLAERSPQLSHWTALADLLDPSTGRRIEASLAHVEEMARRNRMPAELLHRLAVALDALDVQVPIPLWEVASRTPQPATGHLPETGILPRLQDAARKGELARTILLVQRTIGAGGPDAAHLIALGDSLRALRRVGLEREARQIAFEALFAAWPRGASG